VFKSVKAASSAYKGCSKLWKVYQQQVVYCGFKDNKILEWRLATAEEAVPYLKKWKEELHVALSGKTATAETRAKMSAAHKGKKVSEETRKKFSKAIKGLLWWTNGEINRRSRECPGEGWQKGQKHKKK